MGNSTRLIERVTHQRESGIAVPEAKARYSLRFRFSFMAIVNSRAVRALRVKRMAPDVPCPSR
jgi:hypothetical protein